jgi:hypothetical protein
MLCQHLTVATPLLTARIKVSYTRTSGVRTLTKTREHPVEQMRCGKERRGLGDDVGYRCVEKHGGEVDMAVVCRVVVMMRTLGAGKDDDE